MVVWGGQDLPPRAVPWQRAPHGPLSMGGAHFLPRLLLPKSPLLLSLSHWLAVRSWGTCHHVSPHFLPCQAEIAPGWKMPVRRAGIRKCDRVVSAEPLTGCLHAEGAQSAVSLWMNRRHWPAAGQGQSRPSQGLGHLHANPRVSAWTLGAAGPPALCFLPPWSPNILVVSTG